MRSISWSCPPCTDGGVELRNAPDLVRFDVQPILTDNDGSPELEWPDSIVTVRGRFTFLDAEESEFWRHQQVTASLRVPLSVTVRPDDRLVCQGRRWRVVTVRDNRLHRRLMLEQVP